MNQVGHIIMDTLYNIPTLYNCFNHGYIVNTNNSIVKRNVKFCNWLRACSSDPDPVIVVGSESGYCGRIRIWEMWSGPDPDILVESGYYGQIRIRAFGSGSG